MSVSTSNGWNQSQGSSQGTSSGSSQGTSGGTSQGTSGGTSTSQNQSSSFVPQQEPQLNFLTQFGNTAGQLGSQQYGWAQDQFANNSNLTDQNVNSYLENSDLASQGAQRDYQNYNDIFNPAASSLTNDWQSYTSPERVASEMGRAQTTTAQNFDSQRANAEKALQSYGVNPSDPRYAGATAASRTAQAAAEAGAGTQARLNTEATGRQLRSEALQEANILPGQTATEQNVSMQGNTGAENAALSNTSTGALTMGTAPNYLSAGINDVKFEPLGTDSSGYSTSDNSSQNSAQNASQNTSNNGSQNSSQNTSQGQNSSQSAGQPSTSGASKGPTSSNPSQPSSSGSQPSSSGSRSSNPSANPSSQSNPYSQPGAGVQPVNGNGDGGNPGVDQFGNPTQPDGSTTYDFNNPGGDPTNNDTGTPSDWGPQWGGDPGNTSPDNGSGTDTGTPSDWGPQWGSPNGGDYTGGDEFTGSTQQAQWINPTTFNDAGFAEYNGPAYEAAGGGAIPDDMSPSGGSQVDDVPAVIPQTGGTAQLNAGEFVIPRDVHEWMGQKFFQDLIAKARKARQADPGPAHPTVHNGVQHHDTGGAAGIPDVVGGQGTIRIDGPDDQSQSGQAFSRPDQGGGQQQNSGGWNAWGSGGGGQTARVQQAPRPIPSMANYQAGNRNQAFQPRPSYYRPQVQPRRMPTPGWTPVSPTPAPPRQAPLSPPQNRPAAPTSAAPPPAIPSLPKPAASTQPAPTVSAPPATAPSTVGAPVNNLSVTGGITNAGGQGGGMAGGFQVPQTLAMGLGNRSGNASLRRGGPVPGRHPYMGIPEAV